MKTRNFLLVVFGSGLSLVGACHAQSGVGEARVGGATAGRSATGAVSGRSDAVGVPDGADALGRAVGYPQYPSVSPDGSTIVFSFGGDLWAVSSAGGTAQRITTHPSDETRSAFSPDGRLLAFESEREGTRNIYVMPIAAGPGGVTVGDVRRVTLGDRGHTLAGFSHDGTRVIFTSGHEPAIFRGVRMYSAPVEGVGPATRLTDAYGSAPAVAPDGSYVLFVRGRYDATRPRYVGSAASDVWRLDTASGAFARLTTHAANDADAYPLPDGSIVFVSARDGQNNIWKLPRGAADDARAVQLTRFAPAAGEVTIGHGVRDFAVSPGGTLGAFCVWDTLYTIDLAADRPEPRALRVSVGGDTSELDYTRMNLARQVTEAVLSPDGRTIALVARGEIFVRSTEKDRPTRRVTHSHARERDIAWSPDGRRLYFAGDQTGTNAIYAATVDLAREDLEPARAAAEDKKEAKVDHGKRWADALTFRIEAVYVSGHNDRAPRPSPDGRSLLITRTRGDLVLLDLETLGERVLFEGWNEPEVLWCPDSRHIIYAVEDVYFNSDIWLLDTRGDAPAVNLTRHPDNDSSPRLSADGKVLYFLSDRDANVNGDMALYALNLDRRLDGLSQYELAEYFKTAAENAKKRKPLGVDEPAGRRPAAARDPAPRPDAPQPPPAQDEKKIDEPAEEPKTAPEVKKPDPLKFDTDDAYLRIRPVVSMPGGVGAIETTPGGDRVIFRASVEGSPSLFSVDYRGRDRKTISAGAASGVSVSLTGDRVVFVSAGEASVGRPGGGEVEKMAIDAPVVIEIEQQQRQKFVEAARLLGEGFYHYNLKGLDWPGLSKRYQVLAMRTRTDSEFNRVVNNLFGELDGSHLGIRGGRSTAGEGPLLGYLGVDAEESPEGWRVTRVFRRGPANRETSRLDVGDVILAVDGVPTARDGRVVSDLAVALEGTAGRETLLRVRAPDGSERLVLITPVSAGADSSMRYEEEVARRREMVDRLSGGRLGYLHIRSMDIGSVREFERDLYAAAHGRDGLIIDVRDNGGGWTTDILLASLTAPRHAYTVPRGADPATMPRDAYPRDRRLIYAYNRQISVLINQNSFSNAEIFPHAIKTIRRGKLVGVPTFGAVISTGSATLIDGTTVRMPFRGWYLLDGTDMENNGARPDIEVDMPPEAEVAGTDPQIEAAVRELLDRATREPFWDWNR
jgi:tricorn protease